MEKIRKGRKKRSIEDSEEFDDPRWLEEYSTEELVYPLHQVVVNVAIRDPIALRTTIVKLQNWAAFVNESVHVYELPVRDLVCYQIPLAKLIVQSYNATSFKNLATPFVKFDVTQVNYLEFIELYIHDENVRPRAQDHRIVLYPKTTYTLGYKEHLYLYDDFFRGRPCKEYTSFREDEIADCLVNGDPEEMCIDELNDNYCSVTYFRPVLSKRDKQRNYAVQVGLLLGTERSKTTMIPKTTLSEYVTLVTGIIGFWFGVNLITFHGLSKNVIKTIQREPDQPMVMLELS
ncbi:hypothetical protein HDE_12104 [Halotydeus destructor]|nr:hypothetical protein HDE_12104 [Halotydeus destructor]